MTGHGAASNNPTLTPNPTSVPTTQTTPSRRGPANIFANPLTPPQTPKEATLLHRRLTSIYNPNSPPEDDPTTAEGVALGVLPDREARLWREQIMRIGRYCNGAKTIVNGIDELTDWEKGGLDIYFRRAPVRARIPVKGGQARRCMGAYVGCRRKIHRMNLRKRREMPERPTEVVPEARDGSNTGVFEDARQHVSPVWQQPTPPTRRGGGGRNSGGQTQPTRQQNIQTAQSSKLHNIPVPPSTRQPSSPAGRFTNPQNTPAPAPTRQPTTPAAQSTKQQKPEASQSTWRLNPPAAQSTQHQTPAASSPAWRLIPPVSQPTQVPFPPATQTRIGSVGTSRSKDVSRPSPAPIPTAATTDPIPGVQNVFGSNTTRDNGQRPNNLQSPVPQPSNQQKTPGPQRIPALPTLGPEEIKKMTRREAIKRQQQIERLEDLARRSSPGLTQQPADTHPQQPLSRTNQPSAPAPLGSTGVNMPNQPTTPTQGPELMRQDDPNAVKQPVLEAPEHAQPQPTSNGQQAQPLTSITDNDVSNNDARPAPPIAEPTQTASARGGMYMTDEEIRAGGGDPDHDWPEGGNSWESINARVVTTPPRGPVPVYDSDEEHARTTLPIPTRQQWEGLQRAEDELLRQAGNRAVYAASVTSENQDAARWSPLETSVRNNTFDAPEYVNPVYGDLAPQRVLGPISARSARIAKRSGAQAARNVSWAPLPTDEELGRQAGSGLHLSDGGGLYVPRRRSPRSPVSRR